MPELKRAVCSQRQKKKKNVMKQCDQSQPEGNGLAAD